MGGTYTFIACAARKIRGKDDAMNLAIAGCASGIALGWEGKYTHTNSFGDE